jgi:nucleoside-diphosphate-sugar epimerase
MLNLSSLEGKKVFITGATGLIGRAIVMRLLSYKGGNPITVIALVRDKNKADKIFSGLKNENLQYIVGDVSNIKLDNMGIDYIIHGTSQTSSKAFVDGPAEVIIDNFNGTKNLLEFARINDVKSFVYLSTMEVYGVNLDDEKVYEDNPSYLNTMQPRSCYPESKRLCECLCASFANEYSVPAKVIRLTQTFGEGVNYDDGRVFAEFARCAIEGRNIVLNTKGETKRNYLYIDDAVDAILTVLLFGKNGEAYNAANEETYCSIYEMAKMVAENFGNGKTSVVISQNDDIEKHGYAPTLKMNLSCNKLKALGWEATTDLQGAYCHMIEYMKRNKRN